MTTSSTGPLIPRRRLGAAFRELREAKGETLQQTAKALLFSPSKLSRIENGLAGEPHPRDVRDLIAHFGLDDTSMANELDQLAQAGRVPGWWQEPSFRMKSWLDTFISYESAADRIEAYVPTVVPGVIQTREYATECLRRLAPHLQPDELAHQVEIRMQRQEQLRDRPDPPTQLNVVPETVLHRRVGSAQTMADQLKTMIAYFDNPLFEIHVIPFSAGLYEAADVSTMTLFKFNGQRDNNVVALERVQFTQFLDKPDAVEKYQGVIDRLSHYWLDRSASRAFIERVQKQG